MEFTKLSIKEFSEFLKNHPLKTFLQSPKMDDLATKKGWNIEYLGIKENSKIIAACRLVSWKSHLNKRYYYAMRGPLLDFNNYELLRFFTKEIKKYVKNNNGFVFRIDPCIVHKQRDINGDIVEGGIDNSKIVDELKKIGYKHNGFNKEIDFSKQNRWCFCLDLEGKDEKQIFNEMKQNHRNIVKKTDKFGITIRKLGYDELGFFKKITEETSDRKNFYDKSLSYYQEMYKSFNDDIMFLVAEINVKEYINNLEEELNDITNKYEHSFKANPECGKTKELKITLDGINSRIDEAKEMLKEGEIIPLSGAMFILYEDEIDYMFSGSYSKYMHFYAQYAIQWYIIKYGLNNNFRRYNFYGISGIFEKDHHDYGVYKFKKGFNGYVEEYIGDFELPVLPIYHIFRLISKFVKLLKRK